MHAAQAKDEGLYARVEELRARKAQLEQAIAPVLQKYASLTGSFPLRRLQVSHDARMHACMHALTACAPDSVLTPALEQQDPLHADFQALCFAPDLSGATSCNVISVPCAHSQEEAEFISSIAAGAPGVLAAVHGRHGAPDSPPVSIVALMV